MVPSQKNPPYKNTLFDNHARKRKKRIKVGLYQNQYLMPKEEKKREKKPQWNKQGPSKCCLNNVFGAQTTVIKQEQ